MCEQIEYYSCTKANIVIFERRIVNRNRTVGLLLVVLSLVLASCGSSSNSASSSTIDGSSPFDFEDWSDLQVNDLEYNKADRGAGYDNQFWAFEIIGTYNGSSTGVLERLVDGLLGDDGILVQEFSTYERYDPDSFGRSDFFSADVVPGTTINTIFWFETDGSVKDAQIVLSANGKTVYVKPGIAVLSKESANSGVKTGAKCGDGGGCLYGQSREAPSSLKNFGFIAYVDNTLGKKLTEAAAKLQRDVPLCGSIRCRFVEAVDVHTMFLDNPYERVNEAFSIRGIGKGIDNVREYFGNDLVMPNIEVLSLMCGYLWEGLAGYGGQGECSNAETAFSKSLVGWEKDMCWWSGSETGDGKILGVKGSVIVALEPTDECRGILVRLF
jgi:hypothetical protein